MTQIETSGTSVQSSRLAMPGQGAKPSSNDHQNGHVAGHLTSSANSSPLITNNTAKKILAIRPNATTKETDFSINLSSIQHAIDNTDNHMIIHNYTNELSSDADHDFSYKNLLSTKSHHQNGYNSITTSGSGKHDVDDIKVQVYYCGIIMVVYIGDDLKLDDFIGMLKKICKFDQMQLFTVKWVDEEGDPCTLSSQLELDEALRLYHVNKESELIVHIFANIPERPGTQCVGEDRSIYRRGARRWRKIYLVNGHKYQAKRFARTALCKVCQDRIWGLGRQG